MPRTRRPRRRRLLHVLAGVLFCTGVLLVAETVVTVVWQDPFTALRARGAQHRLARQLDAQQPATLPVAAEAASRVPARVRTRAIARLARREARLVPPGGPLGRILIPRVAARFVFVNGSDPTSLKLGPGHYDGTAMPGEPGTIGIAGHRTTYLAPFRHLDALRRGDRVLLQMPYGTFIYRVVGSRVVAPSDVGVLADHGRRQRLVLTACTPLYSAAERLVVTAVRVGGPTRARASARPARRLGRAMRREVPFTGARHRA